MGTRRARHPPAPPSPLLISSWPPMTLCLSSPATVPAPHLLSPPSLPPPPHHLPFPTKTVFGGCVPTLPPRTLNACWTHRLIPSAIRGPKGAAAAGKTQAAQLTWPPSRPSSSPPSPSSPPTSPPPLACGSVRRVGGSMCTWLAAI